MLGAYLALLCWTKKLDCVSIDRFDLVSFWGGTKRVEAQRLDWFQEDVCQYFPHFVSLNAKKGSGKFAGVYISRVQFPDGIFSRSLSDKQRITELICNGVKTELIQLPTEREIVNILGSVSFGLTPFP